LSTTNLLIGICNIDDIVGFVKFEIGNMIEDDKIIVGDSIRELYQCGRKLRLHVCWSK
jgi:hypothetical protein